MTMQCSLRPDHLSPAVAVAVFLTGLQGHVCRSCCCSAVQLSGGSPCTWQAHWPLACTIWRSILLCKGDRVATLIAALHGTLCSCQAVVCNPLGSAAGSGVGSLLAALSADDAGPDRGPGPHLPAGHGRVGRGFLHDLR